MNSCQRVDTLVSAYLDDETSVAETRFLEGHLTACARCREQVEAVEVLLARVHALPRAEVSAGFTDRVVAAARGAAPSGLDEPIVVRERTAWEGWGLPLAAAATLAVVLFLGVSRLGGDAAGPVADSRTTTVEELTRDMPAATPARDPAPGATSLSDVDPLFGGVESDGRATSIGLASDQYVLEDWALRQPTGGGDAVLTRVSNHPERPVVVEF